MKTPLAAILLLSACNASLEPVLATSAPAARIDTADTGGPSSPLTLWAEPLVAGQIGSLVVTGACPSEKVAFVRGAAVGPGPCKAKLGGQCLGVVTPASGIGHELADGDGQAFHSFTVPLAQAGNTLYLQAVILRGPGGVDAVLSNVVEAPIQ